MEGRRARDMEINWALLHRGSFPYIYYYWPEKYRSFWRGLRYKEVIDIEVPLYNERYLSTQ